MHVHAKASSLEVISTDRSCSKGHEEADDGDNWRDVSSIHPSIWQSLGKEVGSLDVLVKNDTT